MSDEPGGKPPLDMVENVARALFACEYKNQSGWTFEQELRDPDLRTYWMTSARAAIAAMREPTQAMIQAGCDAELPGGQWGEPGFRESSVDEKDVPVIWSGMIAAALTPQAPERGGSTKLPEDV